MSHSKRRIATAQGLAPWLAPIVLLLPSSALWGQASGGGLIHGGGKGGVAAVVTAPGALRDDGASTKAGGVEPEPITPIVLPSLCTLSAPLLSGAACSPISCGPNIQVPCASIDGGIGMIAAGTGLREAAHGTISLYGASSDASIVLALAIWAELGAEHPTPGSRTIRLDGHDLTGKLLSEGDDPCWFGEEAGGTLRTYMADATALMTEELNRDYRVEVPYAQTMKRATPWPGPLGFGPPEVKERDELLLEGISLIVFHSSNAIPTHSTTYLHTANEMLAHFELFEMRMDPPPPETSGGMQHLMVVADNQSRRQDGAVAPYRVWMTDDGPLNPLDVNYAILRGPLSLVDKHMLHGADGGPIAQLWDTAISLLAPGTAGMRRNMPLYRIGFEPIYEEDAGVDETGKLVYRSDCSMPLIQGIRIW